MKFKNKKTGAIVNTIQEEYYSKNSDWEIFKETKKKNLKKDESNIEDKKEE